MATDYNGYTKVLRKVFERMKRKNASRTFANEKENKSWREKGGWERKETKKIIICLVHVQAPPNKYNHYILQLCTVFFKESK